MREEYDYLTDATRDTLTDHVKPAATGWGKALETIYQILRGEKQDPWAYTRSFLEGLLAGGVSIAAYEHDIAYLKIKHAKDDGQCTHEAFRSKNHAHSGLLETYLKASADGHIDLKETEQLLGLVAIEKPLIETLEKTLLANKAKFEKGDHLSAVSGGQR